MRLGQLIERWRAVERRSLRDLADEIGIHHRVLMDFETGKRQIVSDNFVKILSWAMRKGGK